MTESPETTLLRQQMEALKYVRLMPASWDKRFILNVCYSKNPTEREVMMIERLAWKYRRQLKAELVPANNPGPMPPKPAFVEDSGP